MSLVSIFRLFSLGLVCLIGPTANSLWAAQEQIESVALPLRFEANEGRLSKQAKFLARASGYQAYLTSSGIDFQFAARSVPSGDSKSLPGHEGSLRIEMVGSSPSAIAGIEQLPGTTNYFSGKDPALWHTDIHSYGRVLYRSIYPGIDLAFYGHKSEIESDFIVSAHADVRQVLLRLHGGQPRITVTGDLAIAVVSGELIFRKPRAYQNINGTQYPVEVRYHRGRQNIVRFEVGAYDRDEPLIIDPVVLYSTYLGGSGGDVGTTLEGTPAKIAADSTGNVYLAGITHSLDFPTTNGAYAAGCSYPNDGSFHNTSFISKVNPTGSALIFSTYLCDANVTGLAVDSSGIYVTGAHGPMFPTTTGALQTSRGSSYIAKLSAAGDALVYSTYFGGSGNDQTTAIGVDNGGNAYVTGSTVSVDFPTKTALYGTLKGPQDAFVSKLGPAGNVLVYSTYLGGSDIDAAVGLAVDGPGNTYVVGITSSTDFPTANALHATSSPNFGAFVSKLTPTGASLTYSTYFDASGSIAADASGNSYVAGSVSNTSFPGVVDKLSTSGASVYSINLSGVPQDVAVDAAGNAFVVGLGSGTGDHDPLQVDLCNAYCLAQTFVLKLDPSGNTVYSTPFAGTTITDTGGGHEPGTVLRAIATDGAGNAYVGGFTVKDTILVNPLQGAFGGGVTSSAGSLQGFSQPTDALLAKIGSTDAPALGLSAWKLDFGPQHINAASSPATITIADQGSTDLTLGAIPTPVPGGDFSLSSNTCSASVPATTSCQITVTFRPTGLGTSSGTITISDNVGGPHVIELTGMGALPSVTLTPQSLSFSESVIGATTAPQTVSLANSGPVTLNITRIDSTGDFLESNNCGASLSAGSTCTISVTFTPTVLGARTGSITISDDAADTPQTIALTGNGAAKPTETLSANNLTFGNQVVGVSAPAQSATLTNTGSTVLTISSIAVTGANAGDFALNNQCPTPLAAGANCTFSVTFTPGSAGAKSAAVIITDNSVGSPRNIALTGSGQDFALSVPSGSASSATIAAGQTATYTVSLSSIDGFSQSVSISCSGSPKESRCSASPNPVVLNGSAASTVITISVVTTARSVAPWQFLRDIKQPSGNDRHRMPLLTLLALLVLALSLCLERRRRFALQSLPLLLLLLAWTVVTGCGGGSSSSGGSGSGPGTPGSTGTPAGAYSLTVSGTFGSGVNTVSRTTTLSLTVQ